jgi:hypothetical protein
MGVFSFDIFHYLDEKYVTFLCYKYVENVGIGMGYCSYFMFRRVQILTST